LRVNGADLRAKAVGEGGNLGLTQLGRIEYAANGGRINTDFIDNSAGVDTSDHEVNIKILLSAEMAAGRLDLASRDSLLASMTDEVAAQVLRNNYDQNLALANSTHQADSMVGVHADWIERLEQQGLLNRSIEFLPSAAEMKTRRTKKLGLSSPEICTLLAYTKIALEAEIGKSELPDDPALNGLLLSYFPVVLRERYAEQMQQHRLQREIITTVAVNQFVNTAGITCFHRLSVETGADAAEVLRAQMAARLIVGAEGHDESIRKLDRVVDARVQTRLRMEVRTLVERATRWLITNRRRPTDIDAAVSQLADGFQQVLANLPDLLQGRDMSAHQDRASGYRDAGVDPATATVIAGLPAAYSALGMVQTARREQTDILRVAATHFALSQRLGLDRLLTRTIELPREDRWQTMARAALRDDLHTVHAQLTAEVLRGRGDGPVEDLIDRWAESTAALATSVATLETVCNAPPDLARISVGVRVVRALLPLET
jgi:glutamate dehydrogenase